MMTTRQHHFHNVFTPISLVNSTSSCRPLCFCGSRTPVRRLAERKENVLVKSIRCCSISLHRKFLWENAFFFSSRNCDIEEESVFGMFVSATCECPENISIILPMRFAVFHTYEPPLVCSTFGILTPYLSEEPLLHLRQPGPVWPTEAHRPADLPVSRHPVSVGPGPISQNDLSAWFSVCASVCACVSASPWTVLDCTWRRVEPLRSRVKRCFARRRHQGPALIPLVLLWGGRPCLVMNNVTEV